jgi:hypothetical protein
VERQNKLVIQILTLLQNAGILDQVLLIGSWCAAFYKYYFSSIEYHPAIRTRDIDFLIPARHKFKRKLDLENVLKPLGFEIEFFAEGYMKLESEDLSIEFLTPEIGRSRTGPFRSPSKTQRATLKAPSLLMRNPVMVKIGSVLVRLPHPADYALQKLIISGQRKRSAKAERTDRVVSGF